MFEWYTGIWIIRFWFWFICKNYGCIRYLAIILLKYWILIRIKCDDNLADLLQVTFLKKCCYESPNLDWPLVWFLLTTFLYWLHVVLNMWIVNISGHSNNLFKEVINKIGISWSVASLIILSHIMSHVSYQITGVLNI